MRGAVNLAGFQGAASLSSAHPARGRSDGPDQSGADGAARTKAAPTGRHRPGGGGNQETRSTGRSNFNP